MNKPFTPLKFFNSFVGKLFCAVFTSSIAGIIVYFIVHPLETNIMVPLPDLSINNDTLVYATTSYLRPTQTTKKIKKTTPYPFNDTQTTDDTTIIKTTDMTDIRKTTKITDTTTDITETTYTTETTTDTNETTDTTDTNETTDTTKTIKTTETTDTTDTTETTKTTKTTETTETTDTTETTHSSKTSTIP